MSILLIREIGKLDKQLLALSALAEENVAKAVRAIEQRDRKLAAEVIEGDRAIDNLEVEVEEECLKVLALHQPVAGDLRFIVAMLKINSDLERVGDLACSIAQRALVLIEHPAVETPFDLHDMATKVLAMIGGSVDALVRMDRELAQRICADDKAVDRLHRSNYDFIRRAILGNPQHIDTFIALMTVSRSLERIGDHATNIAEDVIYLLDGQIVRHAKRQNEDKPREPRAKLP